MEALANTYKKSQTSSPGSELAGPHLSDYKVSQNLCKIAGNL